MKVLIILTLLTSVSAYAQFEALPDSPLDTSMGDAAGDTAATVNQITPDENFEEREEEREEELLESRYDVPDTEEEEEFNKNGN